MNRQVPDHEFPWGNPNEPPWGEASRTEVHVPHAKLWSGELKTYGTKGVHLESPSMPGDVGYNLPAAEDAVVPPGGYLQIMTGIHYELPEGLWGLIVPRSSANRSAKAVVLTGVIDNGYRGEIGVMIHNVHQLTPWERIKRLWDKETGAIVVRKGQSLGQLVVYPAITPPLREVGIGMLSDSHRGNKGYGSTGNGV